MKYCPYCGAVLPDGVISFCAECGKTLPERTEEAPAKKAVVPPKKRAAKQSVSRKSKRAPKQKKRPADAKPEEQVLPDDTYDGYYNDVLPSDLDREKEGLDKELIKRIAAISVGMLLIVGLCVVVIYLL